MMKTKRWYVLTITTLLLAAAALVVLALMGSGSPAVAAPGEMAAATIPAPAMAALPDANCTLLDTTRTCEVWAVAGTVDVPGLAGVPIWGFTDNDPALGGAAQLPGPVIRANVGETLEIVLHNEIATETVALAFPGQELIPDLGGVSTGSTATYSFTADKAGTLPRFAFDPRRIGPGTALLQVASSLRV